MNPFTRSNSNVGGSTDAIFYIAMMVAQMHVSNASLLPLLKYLQGFHTLLSKKLYNASIQFHLSSLHSILSIDDCVLPISHILFLFSDTCTDMRQGQVRYRMKIQWIILLSFFQVYRFIIFLYASSITNLVVTAPIQFHSVNLAMCVLSKPHRSHQDFHEALSRKDWLHRRASCKNVLSYGTIAIFPFAYK